MRLCSSHQNAFHGKAFKCVTHLKSRSFLPRFGYLRLVAAGEECSFPGFLKEMEALCD